VDGLASDAGRIADPRNAAAAATSLPVPMRRVGIAAMMASFRLSLGFPVMAVSTKPGTMQLTVTLRLAISWASDLARKIMK
jgi:hypothetical protein